MNIDKSKPYAHSRNNYTEIFEDVSNQNDKYQSNLNIGQFNRTGF